MSRTPHLALPIDLVVGFEMAAARLRIVMEGEWKRQTK